MLAIYENKLYDISDYLQTFEDNNGSGGYDYLNSDLVAIFKQQPGQDITKSVNNLFAAMDEGDVTANKACLDTERVTLVPAQLLSIVS